MAGGTPDHRIAMKVNTLRWQQTCELFHELSDLDAEVRASRLLEIGATDPHLKAAVEELIAADTVANQRLARLDSGIHDVLHRNTITAPVAAVDALGLAGKNISHFHVMEPIAMGGMGIVYRARDTRLQRDVALKLPLTPIHLDSQGRSRFLREANAAGALDHPNLCVVYEAGEAENGWPFLAMALYEGETLKTRIAREGALPIADALHVSNQIARGLAFAHNAGVVHRDLKPGNVMLLHDGGVKILDFGLAKFADTFSHTASSAGLGTAAYMSPEQVRGRAIDTRSDLWSLGVLLYEMLTGSRPFAGDDPVTTMHAILHAEPPRLSNTRGSIPRSVDELVAVLLQKDPAHRYASANNVAADLDAIARGATATFRRPVAQRTALWLRTRPRRVKAGLAVGALAVMASFAAGTGMLAQNKPTENAQAYQFYLRGRQYEETNRMADADTLYKRALALDPGFALARARLALVLMSYSPRPDRARLEQGRQEATTALRTQPDLAEAHYAIGLYWRSLNQLERALASFERARKGLRKSSVLHADIGRTYRNLGRWDEAVKALEHALELDPTNIGVAPTLAITYGRMRRYREAQAMWGRYIAVTPDAYGAMIIKGHSAVRWQGTSDTLAAAVKRIPADWDSDGMGTFARVSLARLQRNPQRILSALAASRSTVSEDDMLFRPHSLLRAFAYSSLGEVARAAVNYDSARVMLEDSIKVNPGDFRLHIALGFAMSGLNRKEEAVRAAQRAMALAPVSANVVTATCAMGSAAEILAAVGENGMAIELLDRLLSMPAGREASVPFLRVDPAYDPLRSDPRFEAMLKKYVQM